VRRKSPRTKRLDEVRSLEAAFEEARRSRREEGDLMAHRSSRRRGEPTKRDIKLREEQARREFERREAKKLKKVKANEVSRKESEQ